MHPILEDRGRVFVYLAAWLVAGASFALLLTATSPLDFVRAAAFAVPLCLVYGFICLGAHWVCLATPPRTAHIARVFASLLGAAARSALAWLFTARGWAIALDRTALAPGI